MNKLDNDVIARIKTLRLSGSSLNQIVDELGIGKSTASNYCKGLRPNNPNRKDCNKHATIAAQKKWKDRIAKVIKEAEKEWDSIKKNPIDMGFLGLYWGEGSKSRNGGVAISNQDPAIIKIANDWIKSHTDKQVKVDVTYYNSHNVNECMKFWQNITGLEINMVENRDHRGANTYNARCPYGRCRIRVSDYRLFHSIMTWIKRWSEEIA